MRPAAPAADVDEILEEVQRRGQSVVDAPAVAFTLPDADDQAFLEVAVAGGADAVVTGNRKDFPDACGVRILSPADLVDLLAPLRA